MTEIDHNAVKQRMVDILQSNSNLYNINDVTKFIYLKVGEPPGNPLPTPPTYPGLWITNSRPLETILPNGVITADAHTYLAHSVDYEIKFMVNEQDSIVAEQQLDTFQKLIMETLEATTTLQLTYDAWVLTTVYVVGDIVTNDDIDYTCILANTAAAGNEPPNATFWTVLAFDPKANNSWPSRVDTFRQNQDGQDVRGRSITWRCKINTA